MKMWVANTNSGEKWFYSQDHLLKFLSNEKLKKVWSGPNLVPALNTIEIQTVEVEFLEKFKADEFFESYVESSNRELKLEAVLGDEFSQKVDKFKTMFEQLAEDNILKTKFKAKLDTVAINKKSISKLIVSNVGYLFAANYSVEWYRAILDLHNFKKIDDFYQRELVSKSGYITYGNVKVNDEAKANFQIAKSKK